MARQMAASPRPAGFRCDGVDQAEAEPRHAAKQDVEEPVMAEAQHLRQDADGHRLPFVQPVGNLFHGRVVRAVERVVAEEFLDGFRQGFIDLPGGEAEAPHRVAPQVLRHPPVEPRRDISPSFPGVS